MSKNVYVVDIECDALLDDVTKIHVVSYTPLSHFEPKSITDYDEMREFFSQDNLTVLGHNFVCYDSQAVKKILGVEPTYRIIDTLGVSWYLESSSQIIKHGLEAWGGVIGVEKPKIDDWSSDNIEAIVARCTQDILINWKLWKEVQQPYLRELYDNNVEEIHRLLDYITFKLDCFNEQQYTGVSLDVDYCLESLQELQTLADEKTKALVEAMPKIPIKGIKTKPKVMYNKDGELTVLGEKWLDFLNEQNLGPSTDGPVEFIKGYEDGKPSSSEQVKSWLYSLGWEPKHIKFHRDKKKNEVRQIPQIGSEFDKAEVCDSVKELIVKEPAIEHLSGLSTINHRIGVLSGFIRDFKDGGRLYQELGGFTNTFRAKHRVLVNLPKPGNPWAESIRACLTAGEGVVLCGSDLSGVEDATKQHYIFPYAPEYVKELQSSDYDAHTSMGVAAGLMTEDEERFYKWYSDKENYQGVVTDGLKKLQNLPEIEQKGIMSKLKDIRQKAKVVNFSATYSVGAKTLARNMKVGVPEATKILDAYWEKNKSIKQFCASVERKTVRGQMWLKQPVSGFWYSLRAEKDIFSTCNQGTAVYVFDTWVKHTREQGMRVSFQAHDEQTLEVHEGSEEEAKKVILEAIRRTNEELKLNVEIGCSIDFGHRYTDVH